ncbi:hypothetical protein ACPXCS_17200 [Streptomyces sp. DT190]|uniref:hypothetical protein n=1 Tax=unclassified Streptomyces TaxID=2593676 RepID=UPI003CE884F0
MAASRFFTPSRRQPCPRPGCASSAEHGAHIVAAAHLPRHRADAEAGADHRGAAGIDWFAHRPAAPLQPDSERAAGLLTRACPQRLDRRNALVRLAAGPLPAPLVHGLPRD